VTDVTFATSAFAPVALGFLGLATGYLIWGVEELFGFPHRDASVDRSTGMWAIWMSGFCQFFVGAYLFAGLAWFGTFKAPALYTAALAFSAYGIHWFVIGWNRYQGNDTRPDAVMAVPFVFLGLLGAFVFFKVGIWAVGVLFVGLVGVYVAKIPATLGLGSRVNAAGEPVNPGLKAMGLFRVVTGVWLIYLFVSTTLDLSLGYHLPAG